MSRAGWWGSRSVGNRVAVTSPLGDVTVIEVPVSEAGWRTTRPIRLRRKDVRRYASNVTDRVRGSARIPNRPSMSAPSPTRSRARSRPSSVSTTSRTATGTVSQSWSRATPRTDRRTGRPAYRMSASSSPRTSTCHGPLVQTYGSGSWSPQAASPARWLKRFTRRSLRVAATSSTRPGDRIHEAHGSRDDLPLRGVPVDAGRPVPGLWAVVTEVRVDAALHRGEHRRRRQAGPAGGDVGRRAQGVGRPGDGGDDEVGPVGQ